MDYLIIALLVVIVLLIVFAVVGWRKYLRTTAEAKALSKELEETKNQAENAKEVAHQAHLAKSEFLYNVSQEIQMPISVIMGYNEMIMNETKENATGSYAANIQFAGRSLEALLSDISDITKLEEDTLKMDVVAYYVSSMLQDIASYSSYIAKKKNLELRLEIDENIPKRLLGDVVRITQMLNKIISNAVKYTKDGFVAISVKWTSVETDKGVLHFAVQDSGVGMSPGKIHGIVNSHLLIGDRHANPNQGIGLGLVLVTKILKSMNSNLEIVSEEGKGSTFSFGIEQKIADAEPVGKLFPAYDGGTGEKEVSQKVFVAPRAKILVVDDNTMNQDLMKGLLKPTRVLVDTALNGEEALLCLKKRKYNLVFMDHLMPVMGGIETMKKIREENLCENVPVFAFTAMQDAEDKTIFINAGFEDVLKKPILGKELLEVVREHLPKELVLDKASIQRRRQQEAEKEERLPEDGIEKQESEKAMLPAVLLLSDEADNELVSKEALSSHYEVIVGETKEWSALLKEKEIRLIVLQCQMLSEDVLETIRSMKDSKRTMAPVVLVMAKQDEGVEEKLLSEDVADILYLPLSDKMLVWRLENVWKSDALQRDFGSEVEKQMRAMKERRNKLERVSVQVMAALASLVDAKSVYMKGHSQRVAEYAKMLAERMGKSEREQEDVFYAGLLHDIGKIGIPDSILGKVPKLTEEDWVVMKTHSDIGADILSDVSDMEGLDVGARWHHERYDGSGYPDGLKGNEIPEIARIIGVADAYDAMTSSRSYRDELSMEEARREIEKGIGTQFDPYIAKLFLQIIDEHKDDKILKE